MDAKAVDALSVAVGHSMPSGLVKAMAEIESLREQVAELQEENRRLEEEKNIIEILAFEGRVPFQPAVLENVGSTTTWREQLVGAAEEIDRLDEEASKWYEKYARATRCPPGRSRRGPYVRPAERQRR